MKINRVLQQGQSIGKSYETGFRKIYTLRRT